MSQIAAHRIVMLMMSWNAVSVSVAKVSFRMARSSRRVPSSSSGFTRSSRPMAFTGFTPWSTSVRRPSNALLRRVWRWPARRPAFTRPFRASATPLPSTAAARVACHEAASAIAE
jgi:hypothetical protein